MPLNFPTPNLGDPTTLTHTVAGITWTWNTTKNVWSSDISPASDGAEVGSLQTVTDNGAVTTNTCEFQAGVSVTGGSAASVVTGICRSGERLAAAKDGAEAAIFNPQGNSQFTVGSSDRNKTLVGLQGISSMWSSANHGNQAIDLFYAPITEDTNTSGTVNGVRVVAGETQTGTGQFVGYRSVINTSDVPNGEPYNFYAGGDAPNYFKGLTEHAGGVKVTGGTQADGNIIGNADGSIVLNDSNRITLTSAANSGTGISMRIINLDKTANVIGLGITTGQTGRTKATTLNQVYSNLDTDYGSNAYAYVARSTAVHTANDITLTGFYTALNKANAPNGNAYAFYAGGDALNYFQGNIQHRGNPGDSALVDNANMLNIGFTASDSSILQMSRGDTTSSTATIDIKRTGGSGDANVISFHDSTGIRDSIVFDNGGGISYGTGASDYRLKENIVDLPSAVDTIKSLRPVNFNYLNFPGATRSGFIAHELAEANIPFAVKGTKDATEAIGTLADYDGTVLETEVTEPDELEYTEETTDDEGVTTQTVRTRTWTPSGTRPVYQGVDQTKLIPLLTKALQEALDRIEQLESNTLQPLYATEADLPSATDHHGKTAHVHATGSLYFAHAGNWVKLQNA